MSGALTFNGIAASSLGLRIGAVNAYDAPGREFQTYAVPGRIGDVIPAKDYSRVPNQIREYAAALYMRAATPEAVERRMVEIRRWLFGSDGYAELSDSYEPQFYRRAYFVGDVAPERKGAGQNFQIPLRFSCDPRRFIAGDHHFMIAGAHGTVTYTTPSTVNGFTISEAAKPLIWISNGGDNVSVTFTGADSKQIGKLILVGQEDSYWFDSETLTAYYDDGTPANNQIEDVIGEIRLGPGPVTLSFTSSVVALTFYPRWWVR